MKFISSTPFDDVVLILETLKQKRRLSFNELADLSGFSDDYLSMVLEVCNKYDYIVYQNGKYDLSTKGRLVYLSMKYSE